MPFDIKIYPKTGEKFIGQVSEGNFPDKDADGGKVSGKYVGQIKAGIRHGEGTFNGGGKFDGTFIGGEYVGQWKDGKKHGLGKFTEVMGKVVHDGVWENGKQKTADSA